VVVVLFFVLPRILHKLFYFGPASPVVRALRPSPWVRFWPVVGPIVGFGGVSAFPPAQPYHFCEGVAGGEKMFFARRAPEKAVRLRRPCCSVGRADAPFEFGGAEAGVGALPCLSATKLKKARSGEPERAFGGLATL